MGDGGPRGERESSSRGIILVMNRPDTLEQGSKSPENKGRCGIILVGDRGPEWLEHVCTSDRLGFWGLGVGDSQALYPDVYVRLAQAAMATSQLQLGTWVTNPLTRHPAVTANAIASVDELSGGRAFLGIGTGDSAARNIGTSPATLDHLEAYIAALNELQVTGRTMWQGAESKMMVPARRVPVWLAVSGPRATRLAGRVADGVIFGSGLAPEIIAESIAELEAGAAQAGRDVAEIEVWWLALANLADDDDSAVEELKGSLASFGHMAMKSPAQRRRLDPSIRPAIERLFAEYDSMQHATLGASANARLVEELDLVDYLRGRFAICGSPPTFLRSVDMARRAGANNLWFSVRVSDKERFLRLWEYEIAPVL
jgi:5,10-methylenetetrahydromethanopterin reductase